MSTLDSTLAGEAIAETGGGKPARRRRRPRREWAGWLFALPAMLMYGVFVLRPTLAAIQYSFYDWDGITPATWVGIDNYKRVLTEPELFSSIWHAFFLVIFFTFIPVAGGLLIAALLQEIKLKGVVTTARTALFLIFQQQFSRAMLAGAVKG